MLRCAICYHLYKLKNVKNTHGGVLLLVKLQAISFAQFQERKKHLWMSNTPPWLFFTFFKIIQMVPNRAKHHIYAKLGSKDEFLMTLMKLRIDFCYRSFLTFQNISGILCAETFYWIDKTLLRKILSQLFSHQIWKQYQQPQTFIEPRKELEL